MRQALKSLLGHPVLTRLAARPGGPRIVALCYHDLREDDDFGNWLRVPVSEFDRQLEDLSRVAPLPAARGARRARAARPPPAPRPADLRRRLRQQSAPGPADPRAAPRAGARVRLDRADAGAARVLAGSRADAAPGPASRTARPAGVRVRGLPLPPARRRRPLGRPRTPARRSQARRQRRTPAGGGGARPPRGDPRRHARRAPAPVPAVDRGRGGPADGERPGHPRLPLPRARHPDLPGRRRPRPEPERVPAAAAGDHRHRDRRHRLPQRRLGRARGVAGRRRRLHAGLDDPRRPGDLPLEPARPAPRDGRAATTPPPRRASSSTACCSRARRGDDRGDRPCDARPLRRPGGPVPRVRLRAARTPLVRLEACGEPVRLAAPVRAARGRGARRNGRPAAAALPATATAP